jgi:hypothetical protein
MTRTRAITTSWPLLLLVDPGSVGCPGEYAADDDDAGASLAAPNLATNVGTVDSGDSLAAARRGEGMEAPPGPARGPGDISDAGPPWRPPDCDEIVGSGAVTFSADQGATVTPTDRQLRPVTYTFGLVALGEPGLLRAGSGREILGSDDAGCTWRSLGAAGGANVPALTLRAAGARRAYGFGDNTAALVRIDDEEVVELRSPAGKAGIVGLGVDPDDPDHVRLGDSRGRLWASTDAGESWAWLGVQAPTGSLAYRAAFDPQDLDHVLFGTLGEGVLMSTSGGDAWRRATGLGEGRVNAFNVVVSPAQGEVVWTIALDLEQASEAKSRRIFRSEDGGRSFEVVVESHEAKLYNGNHMFPHPSDPDVLYFVFGSNFGDYGTDLYRYDYAADALTWTHNRWHDTVIEFSPADPSVIYLGLSLEPLRDDPPPPIAHP